MQKDESLTFRADEDSAWKEMLDNFLPAFLAFFFPPIHREVDWSRGYESLDKELAQIRPSHRSGKLLADKLFKVYLQNGKPTWLLVHIEIQDLITRGFSRRVFTYNYRLIDKFKVEVVSLAVITGSGRGEVGRYETSRWGCSHLFQFPYVRIAEYASRWEELEASNNIFARVVQAQLKAIETKGDNQKRLDWKRRLIFSLYRRGYKREEIIALFRFMDWVIRLPKELEEHLQQEVYDYEEGGRMPFLANFEVRAMERGWQRGIEEGIEKGIKQGKAEAMKEASEKALAEKRAFILTLLEKRIGEMSQTMKTRISRFSSKDIEALGLAALDFSSKADLSAWLKKRSSKSSRSKQTKK